MKASIAYEIPPMRAIWNLVVERARLTERQLRDAIALLHPDWIVRSITIEGRPDDADKLDSLCDAYFAKPAERGRPGCPCGFVGGARNICQHRHGCRVWTWFYTGYTNQ